MRFHRYRVLLEWLNGKWRNDLKKSFLLLCREKNQFRLSTGISFINILFHSLACSCWQYRGDSWCISCHCPSSNSLMSCKMLTWCRNDRKRTENTLRKMNSCTAEWKKFLATTKVSKTVNRTVMIAMEIDDVHSGGYVRGRRTHEINENCKELINRQIKFKSHLRHLSACSDRPRINSVKTHNPYFGEIVASLSEWFIMNVKYQYY